MKEIILPEGFDNWIQFYDMEIKDHFRKMGIKVKDIKLLKHSFDVIESVAFNNKKNVSEILSAYELNKLTSK
jgi:hypothetical protein